MYLALLRSSQERNQKIYLGNVEEASDGVSPQLLVKMVTPVPNPVPVLGLGLADDAEQVCQSLVLDLTQDDYVRAQEARHLADAPMFMSIQVRLTPANLSSDHQNLLLSGITYRIITV